MVEDISEFHTSWLTKINSDVLNRAIRCSPEPMEDYLRAWVPKDWHKCNVALLIQNSVVDANF
jgi:hypothetical protein